MPKILIALIAAIAINFSVHAQRPSHPPRLHPQITPAIKKKVRKAERKNNQRNHRLQMKIRQQHHKKEWPLNPVTETPSTGK